MARQFIRANSNTAIYNAASQPVVSWLNGTFAAWIYRVSDGTTQGIWANDRYDNADDGLIFYIANTNQLGMWIDNASQACSSVSVVAADGWCLVVVTKAAGTVAPRGHVYKAGAVPVHADFGGNLGDVNINDGPNGFNIGRDHGLSAYADMHIAAVMLIEGRAMTDSECDRLPAGRWDRWVTGTPAANLGFLQEFPSGRDPVVADVATVRDIGRARLRSTSLTGTARSAVGDPPGFRFSRLTRRR